MLKATDAKVSCCILLFTEARVGKARVGKLEEDARSHRNCKCVYSLLISKAAAAAAMLDSLVVDEADSRKATHLAYKSFPGGAYIGDRVCTVL